MSRRNFVVLLGAVLSLPLLSGCPAPCDPNSCFGCCTSKGDCVSPTIEHCGAGGLQCVSCAAGQVCNSVSGACVSLATGGGAGQSDGGGGGGTAIGGGGGTPAGGGTATGGGGGGTATGGGGGGAATGGGAGTGGGSGVCTSGEACLLPDAGVGTCCDATCRSTIDDPSHCGRCGQSCPSSACSNYVCGAQCAVDGGSCPLGTDCVTLLGSSLKVCASSVCSVSTEGFSCSLGSGALGRCCGGSCADLHHSPNCGQCGKICSGTASACIGFDCVTPSDCSNANVLSSCVVADGGVGQCCDGRCQQINFSDPAHCGNCGTACAPGATCERNGFCANDAGFSADCRLTCPFGTVCSGDKCRREDCIGASRGQACGSAARGACCGAECADLSTSSQHCGQCDRACAPNQFCDKSICKPIPTCNGTNDGVSCPFAPGTTGTCCGSSCVDTSSSSTTCGLCNAQCPTGTACSGGECVQASDGGSISCTSISGDACPDGTVCQQGKCLPTRCPSGSSGGACAFGVAVGLLTGSRNVGLCCNGSCIDSTQDLAHCGGCSRPCTDGICSPIANSSTPGAAFCLATRLSTDCRASCGVGHFCLDGLCHPASCQPPSSVGYSCLDGTAPGACCGSFFGATCENLNTDSSNCGGCGVVCPTGQTCVGGVCQGSSRCERGEVGRFCRLDAGTDAVCCPGAGCTDRSTDSRNCGACGTVCPTGLSCMDSRCVAPICTVATAGRQCDADGGLGQCCGTTCATLKTDALNCGSCGRQCALGETCRDGACALDMCSGSTLNSACHVVGGGVGSCCASGCIDSSSDPLNCGGCGRVCPTGSTCINRVCR